MSSDWHDSVILINSNDPNISRFGTGFIIHQDEQFTYVLTCAHVVREVGGLNKVSTKGIPAMVVASGEDDNIDLSVLRFEGLLDKLPLALCPIGEEGHSFITAGFQFFDQDYLIRPLHGKLGKQVGLESKKRKERIDAWDLQIVDDYRLQPGYSGSPVVDEESGYALGIVSHRHGEGERGLAISVESLKSIWPEMPTNLLRVETYRDVKTRTDRVGSGEVARGSRQDWGGAPDVSIFFGREVELTTLKQWIVEDRCRLVAIVGLRGIGKTRLSVRLGKGGIGKTDLSIKLARGIQEEFEYVIWRRLLNAPPLVGVLSDVIKFLSDQQEIELPDATEDQILRLLYYFQRHRCLLILDNVDTILQPGTATGAYREGYEGYGELFKLVGETIHQSCLLLTSREKPPEVAKLEGENSPVRSFNLGGLGEIEAREIFATVGSFSGSDEDWRKLVELYDGNPLALELVARHINEVFFGNISVFLREGTVLFDELRGLLDWHYERLSHREKEIMYWLAVDREPVSFLELKEDLLAPQARRKLSSTLQSLQRRLPLERSILYGFGLQPVLIEYMTERLIERVSEEVGISRSAIMDYITGLLVEEISDEVTTGVLNYLHRYALLKAQAKEYIRQSQNRVIVKPVIDRLLVTMGEEHLEERLRTILSDLRQVPPRTPSYAGGNVLNLIVHLKGDLKNYDFSNLCVWQAYLQGISASDTNFAHADLSKSVFSEIFGRVLSVAVSLDGKLIASGNTDGKVRVWRVVDFKQILAREAHAYWIESVTFGPDSRILVSCGEDHLVRLWDVTAGETLRILRGHTHWIGSSAFSPDGRMLATASDDGTVRLWDVATGDCRHILSEHEGAVRSVAFSPDGRMLATGGEDQILRLWDREKLQVHMSLRGHTDRVLTVAFSPDGGMLASGGEDRSVRLWDIKTGQCLSILQGHSGRVWSVAFNSKNRLLASGSHDETIRVWDVRTGECHKTLQGHTNEVFSVAFNPVDNTLVSGSIDHTVRIWDPVTGNCLKTLHGYTGSVWSVAFSPDGKSLASGSSDQAVHLWDIGRGQEIRTLRGHTSWIWSVVFSPNGKMLFTGSEDRTVRMWETDTGRCIRIFRGHTSWIHSIAISPDGNTVASCSEDRTVRLWDANTGRCVNILQGHTKALSAVTFSPNNRILASASEDSTICLWDIYRGKCIKTLEGHSAAVWSVAFSPDGNILVSGSTDSTIMVWDVNAGKLLKSLQGHAAQISAVTFSPNGRFLASGGLDQTIKIWSLDTGECINTLKGHTAQVCSIVFSPDGYTLASGSEDETIKLWNVRTGECLHTVRADRLYERMNITGVRGVTEAQKAILRQLGAVDYSTNTQVDSS